MGAEVTDHRAAPGQRRPVGARCKCGVSTSVTVVLASVLASSLTSCGATPSPPPAPAPVEIAPGARKLVTTDPSDLPRSDSPPPSGESDVASSTERGPGPRARSRLSTNRGHDAGAPPPETSQASCAVDGSYLVNGTVLSGTCPSTSGGLTDTFHTNADGTVSMTAEGLDGECTGTMNGCTWIASCLITMRHALRPGDQGVFDYTYTFTSRGFAGAVSESLPPLKALPNGCFARIDAVGVRQ